MTRFICASCGTQYTDKTEPPDVCAICSDDRQYVGWEGQRWTTLEELQVDHTVRFEADGELLGIGITPAFGIPQRSLLVPATTGNILWETTSPVTADAVTELVARGGIDTIVISHPHFYASMVEWSEAFGGVPIVLHANDREWIPDRRSTSCCGMATCTGSATTSRSTGAPVISRGDFDDPLRLHVGAEHHR